MYSISQLLTRAFGGITGGLLLASILCLTGCSNSSSTTLAVEKAAPSGAAVPNSAVASAAFTSSDAAPITIEGPTPSPSDEPDAPGLQPKLTKVAPEQLVGRWRDSFFGTRTLTLNADGTATMVLEFDFAGRLMYGRRLEFDMQWSVEGAVVTIDILEGRPAKSARSAIETWGSRYVYLLDCVADRQVEMRDSDGSMNHVLRRIPDENGASSQ